VTRHLQESTEFAKFPFNPKKMNYNPNDEA